MKRSCCGPLCEGDVEAEFAELSGQARGETRSLGALEVIGPKIVIRRPALQHVVDRGQHGRRHGRNRLARTPACFEPLEQRMQVGEQVERMNRTIKEATVQRFYYATHDQLRTHLADL